MPRLAAWLVLASACGDPTPHPDVEAWIDAQEGPRRVGRDEVLRAGDRVQLRYRWVEPAWATIAGIDGTGLVEVYGSTRIEGSGRWEPAPFSLVLDDAPFFQDFVVILAPEPPPDDAVVDALRAGRRIEAAAVASMTIPKTRSAP